MNDCTETEGRVLIVAPTGRDGPLLAEFLRAHAIAGHDCPTVTELADEFSRGAALFVIAAEALDDDGEQALVAVLDGQPTWSDVPILLLTNARSTPLAGDRRIAQLGNVMMVERPVGGGPLLSAVQSGLRARRRQYEVREHLAEREATEAALREANHRKDELLGLVSHELRTPLTLIVGSASLLARRGDEIDESSRSELLGTVRDSGDRLTRLIENMLILAKAEVIGDASLEPFLVQRVLPSLAAGLRPLKGSRPLCCHVDDDLPPVLGNGVFFEQIIQNLVHNSEKYSAEGKPVDLAAVCAGRSVMVSVADRGAEYSQPQVDRMFEDFYRDPETSGRVGGLGLGLPVCRRLAEVQGGSITAESRDGGGLVVTLSLPVAAENY